ncbi:hypothetical protein BaRGS_00015718 [Batillaria attramentaria]|uniref:G-protein coupled receptors family 1 profile domain-containing protein n=1 Tax=Batillaria attramentaria TaxID=370345 RepID=A0ABD0L118_9CAEN
MSSANNSLFHADELELEDIAHIVVVTAFLSLFVLTAAIGNALLFYVVLRSKYHRHESDFFIASLATADLIMTMVVFPFTIFNLFQKWNFGDFLCKLWTFLDTALCAVSIYTMSAICMNICFHVKLSFVALHTLVRSYIKSYIVGIWVLAVLVSATITALSYVQVTEKHTPPEGIPAGEICFFQEPLLTALLDFFVVFFGPLLWCLFLYVQVVNRLNIYSSLRRTPVSLPVRSPNDSEAELPPTGLFTITNKRTGITVLGVKLAVFFVAWMPLFLVKLVTSVCLKCTNSTMHSVVVWLPYTNSWISPLIYGMLNKRVHNRLKELCSCGHNWAKRLSRLAQPIIRKSTLDMTDMRFDRFGSYRNLHWGGPPGTPISSPSGTRSVSWDLSMSASTVHVPTTTPHIPRSRAAAAGVHEADEFGTPVDGDMPGSSGGYSGELPTTSGPDTARTVSPRSASPQTDSKYYRPTDKDNTQSASVPLEAVQHTTAEVIPPGLQVLRLLVLSSLRRPRSVPTFTKPPEDMESYSRVARGGQYVKETPERACSDTRDFPPLAQAWKPVPARRSTLTKAKTRGPAVELNDTFAARPQPAPRKPRREIFVSARPGSAPASEESDNDETGSSVPTCSTRSTRRSRPKERRGFHKNAVRTKFDARKASKRSRTQPKRPAKTGDKSASASTSGHQQPAISGIPEPRISEDDISIYLDAVESLSSGCLNAVIEKILSSTGSNVLQSQEKIHSASSSVNSDSTGMYVEVGSPLNSTHQNFLSDDEAQRQEHTEVMAGSGDTAFRGTSPVEGDSEYFTTDPSPENSRENIVKTITTDNDEEEEGLLPFHDSSEVFEEETPKFTALAAVKYHEKQQLYKGSVSRMKSIRDLFPPNRCDARTVASDNVLKAGTLYQKHIREPDKKNSAGFWEYLKAPFKAADMYASQIVFSKAGKHQTPDTTESGNVTASDTLCGQTRPTTSRMLSHQQKNLNEEKKQTVSTVFRSSLMKVLASFKGKIIEETGNKKFHSSPTGLLASLLTGEEMAAAPGIDGKGPGAVSGISSETSETAPGMSSEGQEADPYNSNGDEKSEDTLGTSAGSEALENAFSVSVEVETVPTRASISSEASETDTRATNEQRETAACISTRSEASETTPSVNSEEATTVPISISSDVSETAPSVNSEEVTTAGVSSGSEVSETATSADSEEAETVPGISARSEASEPASSVCGDEAETVLVTNADQAVPSVRTDKLLVRGSAQGAGIPIEKQNYRHRALISPKVESRGGGKASYAEGQDTAEKPPDVDKRGKCLSKKRGSKKSPHQAESPVRCETKVKRFDNQADSLNTNRSKAAFGQTAELHRTECSYRQEPDMSRPNPEGLSIVAESLETSKELHESESCKKSAPKKLAPKKPPRRSVRKETSVSPRQRTSDFDKDTGSRFLNRNNTFTKTQSDETVGTSSLEKLCTDIHIYHSHKPVKPERLKRSLETKSFGNIDDKVLESVVKQEVWSPFEDRMGLLYMPDLLTPAEPNEVRSQTYSPHKSDKPDWSGGESLRSRESSLLSRESKPLGADDPDRYGPYEDRQELVCMPDPLGAAEPSGLLSQTHSPHIPSKPDWSEAESLQSESRSRQSVSASLTAGYPRRHRHQTSGVSCTADRRSSAIWRSNRTETKPETKQPYRRYAGAWDLEGMWSRAALARQAACSSSPSGQSFIVTPSTQSEWSTDDETADENPEERKRSAPFQRIRPSLSFLAERARLKARKKQSRAIGIFAQMRDME